MQGRRTDSKTESVASQNYNEKMDALYRSEGKLDKEWNSTSSIEKS